MSTDNVHIRELAGWGFDESNFRPSDLQGREVTARRLVTEREPSHFSNVLMSDNDQRPDTLLETHLRRSDLAEEMVGLSWTLGWIDVRLLLAFQRRLTFDTEVPAISVPEKNDHSSLINFCFPDSKPFTYVLKPGNEPGHYEVATFNPNVHLRLSPGRSLPLLGHAGSPFFEVANYRGRYFLRDGYHRAFALLRTENFIVPAVIIEARSLQELGASQPWFFSQETLLSSTPPLVRDFLDDSLVFAYDRPRLVKKICVTIKESFEPASASGGSS